MVSKASANPFDHRKKPVFLRIHVFLVDAKLMVFAFIRDGSSAFSSCGSETGLINRIINLTINGSEPNYLPLRRAPNLSLLSTPSNKPFSYSFIEQIRRTIA